MIREEELLTSVAPLPVLSGGLRVRVLAAAGAARARRTRARRALAGASVVFGILGWISWTDSLPFAPGNLAAIEPRTVAGSSAARVTAAKEPPAVVPYCRRDMLIAAMSDDWRMVEAEFKSREEFTRRVQMQMQM
jgi:hypothetical protein